MRAPGVRDLDGFKGLGVPTGTWWEVSVEEGEFERHAGLQMAEKALSHPVKHLVSMTLTE